MNSLEPDHMLSNLASNPNSKSMTGVQIQFTSFLGVSFAHVTQKGGKSTADDKLDRPGILFGILAYQYFHKDANRLESRSVPLKVGPDLSSSLFASRSHIERKKIKIQHLSN